MSKDDIDPFWRHEHAILGQFLAIQAWIHQVDCLVISREDLQSFFRLERFKGTRVKWMLEDLSKWFPFHDIIYYEKKSIGSLFLSRFPIEEHVPQGNMPDQERVAKMRPSAPRTALLAELLGDEILPSFENASLYLGSISTGLIDPRAKITVNVRRRKLAKIQRLQGTQYSPDEFFEELTENFSNILLNEKIPLSITDGQTGLVIIPPNKIITMTMLRYLAECYKTYEIETEDRYSYRKLTDSIDEIRNAAVYKYFILPLQD